MIDILARLKWNSVITVDHQKLATDEMTSIAAIDGRSEPTEA